MGAGPAEGSAAGVRVKVVSGCLDYFSSGGSSIWVTSPSPHCLLFDAQRRHSLLQRVDGGGQSGKDAGTPGYAQVPRQTIHGLTNSDQAEPAMGPTSTASFRWGSWHTLPPTPPFHHKENWLVPRSGLRAGKDGTEAGGPPGGGQQNEGRCGVGVGAPGAEAAFGSSLHVSGHASSASRVTPSGRYPGMKLVG